MRELRPTPTQPVFYGQIHFGYFRDPFVSLNLADADIAGHRWAPHWWRNLRLKEWQHIRIFHDAFICDVAIYDAKLSAASSCILYATSTNTAIHHHRKAYQRGAIQILEQLLHGESYFRDPGYRVTIQNRLAQNAHHLKIAIQPTNAQPGITAALTLHADRTQAQPLIAVLPLNDHRRPHYAHIAACPVEGHVQAGDQTWLLDPAHHRALFAAQKGFLPPDAPWIEANLAGFDQTGVPVTVTLTQTAIQEDDTWNMCCAWISGELTLLGAARFNSAPRDRQSPWQIVTLDERVDLTFTPQSTTHTERNSQHLTGTVHGQIIDDQNRCHTLRHILGTLECCKITDSVWTIFT